MILRADTRPLTDALARLSASLADAPDHVLEALDAVFGSADAVQQIVAVEVDRGPAAGAGEVVVRLQPTDGLRRLLIAAGGEAGSETVQWTVSPPNARSASEGLSNVD